MMRAHSDAKPAGKLWIVLLITALAAYAVAYAPVLSAGYVWDDDQYVTENLVLRSPTGWLEVWKPGTTPQYYPLVFTTFWIEYRLWGLHPLGYHIVNLLLHFGSAMLFVVVMRRLEVPGAAFAAMLFLLHPVMVESVAWVTERKNVLSLFFYLLAFHQWLRVEEEYKVNVPRYFAVIVLFACALLSKTVTCSLPAAILLVDWWRNGRLRARTVGLTLPMFVLGAALAVVTVLVERDHVGVGTLNFGLSPADRCVLAARAAWFYLSKLLWPAELLFIYPRWPVSAAEAWQWIYPAAAMALLAAFWLFRKKVGRGPLVAALLFGGTLVPALGFIDVYPMRYSWVADHFQYHATLGPLALVGAALELFRRRFAGRIEVFSILGAAIFMPLVWRTHWQARIYHDAPTLWKDTVARNPDAWIARHNVATYLVEQGRYDEARAHVERSLALYPNQAEGLNVFAQIALRDGDYQRAIELCEKAIVVGGGRARSEVYVNLSSAFLSLQRYQKALASARLAVQAGPNSPSALSNLGTSLVMLGQFEEARTHLTRSVQIDAASVESRIMLATTLGALGRCDEAFQHLDAALRIAPTDVDAISLRIRCLIDLGRREEARAALAMAQRLVPESPVVKRLTDELSK